MGFPLTNRTSTWCPRGTTTWDERTSARTNARGKQLACAKMQSAHQPSRERDRMKLSMTPLRNPVSEVGVAGAETGREASAPFAASEHLALIKKILRPS